MPEDHKHTSESDHDWMVEALEEEELSEHGLPPVPQADEVTPAGGPPPPDER